MDPASIAALVTAIATAIAAHLKNRDQDKVVRNLQRQVCDLEGKVEDCEKERRILRQSLQGDGLL